MCKGSNVLSLALLIARLVLAYEIAFVLLTLELRFRTEKDAISRNVDLHLLLS